MAQELMVQGVSSGQPWLCPYFWWRCVQIQANRKGVAHGFIAWMRLAHLIEE